MAPGGLIISKLAVQASAQDETARISLPRDPDAKQASRWGLFSGDAPRLISTPQIHVLPLTAAASGIAETAATLLSLSLGTRAVEQTRTPKPSIEISRTTGQVYIVSDQQTQRRRRDSMPSFSSPGQVPRREFLVILEFEHDVERVGNGYQLDLPIPRCLDNTVRFQIHPPSASSSNSTGEVSIVTDPKILPVPASTFRNAKQRFGEGQAVQEEGWEDGESLGPEDLDSEDGDEGGSWLEGRFQSTDNLRFDWSFASSTSSIPLLRVCPAFDPRQPSISVEYKAIVSTSSQLLIEAELPDGWGWSELSIEGDALRSWSCVDGEWWDYHLAWRPARPFEPDESSVGEPDESSVGEPDESSVGEPDDSFSTIRARRNPQVPPAQSQSRSASSSLMRQPLPQLDADAEEFSFEFGHAPPRTPLTPASNRSVSVLGQSPNCVAQRLVLPKPASARCFEMEFPDDVTESSIRIIGTLVPLTRALLVSPSVPVKTPVFRLDGEDQCHFSTGSEEHSHDSPLLVDIASPPAITWTNQHGEPLIPTREATIKGDITVQLRHLASHHQTTISFTWPKHSAEVKLRIPSKCEAGDVKVVKATMRGRALPRATTAIGEDTEVRLGKGDGVEGICTVVLEVSGEAVLPLFDGAVGRLKAELVGHGWQNVRIQTDLTRHSPTSYSITLPSSAQPYLTAFPHSPRSERSMGRTIWSWSTLINVFMLYLLLSLAQQVQRLRAEVAFIGEEAKDLRTYGLRVDELSERLSRVNESIRLESSYPAVPTSMNNQVGAPLSEGEAFRFEPFDSPTHDTALGRVVLGQTGWERLFAHPTVRSLGQSLGWIWHTVVWLMHA